MIGKMFGKLTVISELSERANGGDKRGCTIK